MYSLATIVRMEHARFARNARSRERYRQRRDMGVTFDPIEGGMTTDKRGPRYIAYRVTKNGEQVGTIVYKTDTRTWDSGTPTPNEWKTLGQAKAACRGYYDR